MRMKWKVLIGITVILFTPMVFSWITDSTDALRVVRFLSLIGGGWIIWRAVFGKKRKS